MTKRLEKLRNPPIIEVACGVHFAPQAYLTPVSVGAYWQQHIERFPTHELRPAVSEAGFVLSPVPPLRVMLTSTDGAFVKQIQNDRFYLNWRKTSETAEYPRFSDWDDHKGVGSQALEAFAAFRSYCKQTFRSDPIPTMIELAKVDVFSKPKHWKSFADLAVMLPWLENFAAFSKSPAAPSIALRFEEKRASNMLTVTLTLLAEDGQQEPSSARLEARVVGSIGARTDLEALILEANGELNRVFSELIPEQERTARFQEGG